MLGPAPSHYVAVENYDWMLMVGDESALPAIAATIEQLPSTTHARVFLEVADSSEQQDIAAPARTSPGFTAIPTEIPMVICCSRRSPETTFRTAIRLSGSPVRHPQSEPYGATS